MFNLDQDAFVAFVYVPPHNTPYLQKEGLDLSNIFQRLENDIGKYNTIGRVCLLGDFNAYTNTMEDFVNYDSVEETFLPLPFDYKEDWVSKRENLDPRAVNESGKSLILPL